ncbi:hypothetical protein IEQ34_013741 [Dendrobium chrysotoxum]|uniref:Uncharacterized protein n=1 Tax=Dendrobium chrysotoxum TaxID=161865 RepID=A0AAV7GPC3_DENCH|nr:hypothetical protein IEQ34_013741 [Dendrobium chrysotoxum]
MSSARGEGALDSTQKGGSGSSDRRRVSKNQDDHPGNRPLDMLDVVPSTHEVVEPVRAPRTMEVDESRRSTLIDDVSSSITLDGLIIICKKFHLPDDLVMVVPKKTDQAQDPPNGFFTIYEMTLRAGLRFPLAPELLEIFRACGVPLAQFLCRTVKIIVGLTSLQEELRHISQYVLEEKLFKIGLSIQAGSSHGVQLKKSKKRRVNDAVGLPSDGEVCREVIHPLNIDITALNSDREVRPLKVPIPEEVLKHICVGRQRAKEVMIQKIDVESQFDTMLDEWNAEFVKIKYLQREYKRKLDKKIKETSALESQLAKCRAEMETISTTLSLQNREASRSRTELIEARTETNQKNEDHLLEKEAAILDADARTEAISLEAVEKFKKSSAHRREIQNYVQEAYNKLFDAEARDLKRRCLEEDFRKAGVTIEGLSPSQASEDSSPDLDDEDVESELRKDFSSDDEKVEIV